MYTDLSSSTCSDRLTTSFSPLFYSICAPMSQDYYKMSPSHAFFSKSELLDSGPIVGPKFLAWHLRSSCSGSVLPSTLQAISLPHHFGSCFHAAEQAPVSMQQSIILLPFSKFAFVHTVLSSGLSFFPLLSS